MTLFTKRLCVALLFSQCLTLPALAQESPVAILAPADGASTPAGKGAKVDYEVKSGTEAHHIHLYVDDNEVATGHKLKGSLSTGALKAGDHKICVAPVNKAHTAIAARACVTVTAK
ncbi:MAG TPA: hypothetical protein VK446_15775 [Methylocystis sp.]|nr:hypothetical protein [Methylocystis sp.]